MMRFRWVGSICLSMALIVLSLTLQDLSFADTPASMLIVPGEALGPETRTAAPKVAIRDLAEAVDPSGLFRVTGRVVNIGSQPVTPVTVAVTFERVTGDDSWKQLVLQQPIAPGADASFSLETYVGIAVVGRYTVEVTAGAGGPASVSTRETRLVPPSVYDEFARQVIQVALVQGPPSNTARTSAVQFLVAISGTGPIPAQWVKDVRVEIVYNVPLGTQEIHLAPSQVRTILIPTSRNPFIPFTVSATAIALATPVVQEVLLGTP